MASLKAFIWLGCFVLLLQIATSHFISPEALQANNNNLTDRPRREMVQDARHHIHHSKKKPVEIPKKPCKVDFEKVSLMPLFKACEPPFPVRQCCDGLKRIACRYTAEINDVTTDCAFDMFYFINQYYPLGWFDKHCKEGAGGVGCKGFT